MYIRDIRVATKMSQPEFAKRIGVSRQTLGSYERKNDCPSWVKIKLEDITKEFGLNGCDPESRVPSEVVKRLLLNSKSAMYALKESIEQLESYV